MMTPDSIDENVKAGVYSVRHGIGVWVRDTHTLIRFEGKDVATWLQSQTSNDVAALQSGLGHANTILDRKGRLQAHFTLHRWDDEYWLVVEKQQAPRLIDQLDSHLFIEDVRMADAGDEVEQVLVQGPRVVYFLSTLLDTDKATASELLPAEKYGCHPIELCGFQVLAFRISETGEDGYLFVTQLGEARPLLDRLLEAGRPFGVCEVDDDAREVLRIEAGIPRFGIDMDTSNRLPETTLEREAVSYEKGCYLGQEVIAKLRAYSSVKMALVGLELEAGEFPPFDSTFYFGGSGIGVLKSAAHSPTLERTIALAYLDRDRRAPGSVIELHAQDGKPFTARVVVLPFYAAPTREERARAAYEDALQRFERDAHDEDDSAIALLREAVLLSPAFEDAYEALGVILNRHHRVDEAIRYMRILARLNPDSVMAHTNLSVFYVAKGMIPEAEDEKAKAAVLQMRHARNAREAEEIAASERQRIRREALERIAMFKEVLEFDPDDPLATFGTGMAYIQLDDYENAVPHLERATQVQKDYSVAYLNLGKCFEFLNRTSDARGAYKAGIECAARKGDLMPLREMERRLKALTDASFGEQVTSP
ncbi:MAG: tetratricopeptide repeat protein [Candidatus Hydrogenedentes bacterium]|nr:tetratricopeptide repeat protein [Candidatus Hydrogenedentota bacterium]